ncbi:DOG1 domain-containing protein [Heracleum sosnowskyi]|uniref:DOG1 domain-containing protein n=1 Tax=Heracleum sosnowskyi TaxID=360622 RepID=A0AAD8MS08_9APIA|nr:DOG1 domain-containing protein [Heracleum sosnowskyi]
MFKSLFHLSNPLTRHPTRRPFKDFYSEWFKTLKHTLLPLLRRSLSSNSSSSTTLLSKHVEMIHQHFQLYYDALDNAASNDVAQLLFPEWRGSCEKPFLWLVHVGDISGILNENWHVVNAWNSPSKVLITRIDEIERGLRLIVPALVVRAREAQGVLVAKIGEEWGKNEGEKGLVAEAVEGNMEEMVSVFVDANRIRRSVLSEIISVTSVYQAAFFLEGLAQFLVGFGDKKLVSEFKRCRGLCIWRNSLKDHA